MDTYGSSARSLAVPVLQGTTELRATSAHWEFSTDIAVHSVAKDSGLGEECVQSKVCTAGPFDCLKNTCLCLD